ncbi:MAG TPA: reverse transcriptase family protein [Candidatus Blautia stercoripullorum]|uniref:RNA-directed DNA polymerase n=1 Tax=Candidatus Blautia stercoripullorum TaxID=2838502 RepID=A0A9D2U6L2_9FIRM|nr:reverse transcriptase family protein [Candidatus Blautia stercoripullorum]
MSSDIWKYCDKNHSREFLLSLNLTGNLNLTKEKQLSLLYGLSNHTEEHYQKIQIPKRNGAWRTLYVPDSLLKYVQKQILHKVLTQLPVSYCASAYKKGCSLKENAAPHTGKSIVLKLDILDFFGNITYISVYQHAFPGELFPPPVRTLLAHLCCYRDFLPQGAPTSPYISNLVLFPFDRYMERWCKNQNITYTRYCDDLTFSGSFEPEAVIRKVSSFLLRMGFEINPKKMKICPQGQRQIITGIVVNEKTQVPKTYRRNLRQEIYYIEKFGLSEHLAHIHLDLTPEKYLEHLKGKLRYVLQINPQDREFQEALARLNRICISH